MPIALPISLMFHVKVVAINLTGWDDKRAEDSVGLKWGSRIEIGLGDGIGSKPIGRSDKVKDH